MLKSISNSYTGIRGFQQSLDMTAHNLSNMNKVAFKEKQPFFQELYYREMEERRFPLAGDPALPPHSGRGVSGAYSKVLLNEGSHLVTGRELDLVIDGEGFFRVEMPDGEYAYTRSGNFALDAEGRIVTQEGYFLGIDLDLDNREDISMEDIQISSDGTVFIPSEGEGEGIEAGTIPVYRFTNPEGLYEAGENLYLPSENSGEALEGAAGDEGFGHIKQGHLEDSNVDLTRQMSSILRNQRSLQASTRALRIADELWAISLNVQA